MTRLSMGIRGCLITLSGPLAFVNLLSQPFKGGVVPGLLHGDGLFLFYHC